MKLVIVNNNQIGKEIGIPIYTSNGMKCFNKGVVLKDKHIQKLRELNVVTIYIEDENDDINLTEVLSTPLRLEILNELSNEFVLAKKKGTINDSVIKNISKKILDNINVTENAFIYNNISNSNPITELSNHSLNVSILSVMIAKDKAYNIQQLENICIGALMHDVGKIFSTEESHTEKGYELLSKSIGFTATSKIISLQHHEKHDGTGYPRRHKGSEIHEFTQIVSIANEYIRELEQENFNPRMAYEKIVAQTNSKFSPEAQQLFKKSVYCYPTGLEVELNNKLQGVVVSQNKEFPERPVVRINGENYDLVERKNLNIMINKVLI